MSETDDTDVLLLIPPNFFLVQSSGSEESLLESSRTVVHKPTSCTAQVLGKLVNQVYSLESRLDSLVLSDSVSSYKSYRTLDTSESIDGRCLDHKSFTFPLRKRRKTKKARSRDLSLTSLDSVRKSIPLLKLEEQEYKRSLVNDTPSMDGDISSIVSTPNKNNDKLLLNEIDEFLTKVESYEGPETNLKDRETTISPENVIKATSDYLSQKLEPKGDEIRLPSGRIVSSNVLDKYIYLVKSNSASASQSEKSLPSSCHKNQHNEEPNNHRHTEITPKVNDISKPLDTKSPSVRRLNFSDKDVQPTSTPKTQSAYLDTFRPTSNKIYDRASKVLEQYKSQNYTRSNTQNSVTDSYMMSPKKDEFKMLQMRSYAHDNREGIKMAAMQNKLIESIDTDLLSLSDLWGEKGDRDRGDSVKLEEERLKREHCESMIQQLQKKILEQQEKLAVALKVDRAKDAAISKLREAWLKLTGSLDKAEERHRSALEKMIREVDNFRLVADDAQKKTNHFETELYKALDLAHDYQEKCKQLTADKKELQHIMESASGNHQEVLTSKDNEIDTLKENYETVMRLNKQSTDCVKNLEIALEKEKSDHAETRSKANDLARQIQQFNDEASLVVQERDLLKEKVNEERGRSTILDRQLCEKQNQTSELLKKCDTLDNEVKALRKQLDLQKNELKSHYQKQLEDAVLSKLQEFQHQLDLAEHEMETNARSKENAIVDTYNKQIVRIEEQHKLEVNLLEEKQREEIKLYRLQLAQASEKIGLLENKLESYRRRRGQIASQLHSVMESQWRQALLILTNPHGSASSMDLTRPDSVSTPVGQDYGPPKIPPLTMPTFSDKLARSEERRHGHSHGGGGPGAPADTIFNFEGLSDHELQHYVKLLLTKPPNFDGSAAIGEQHRDQHRELDEPTSDRPDKQDRKDKTAKRSLNISKPPWKA